MLLFKQKVKRYEFLKKCIILEYDMDITTAKHLIEPLNAYGIINIYLCISKLSHGQVFLCY